MLFIIMNLVLFYQLQEGHMFYKFDRMVSYLTSYSRELILLYKYSIEQQNLQDLLNQCQGLFDIAFKTSSEQFPHHS